MEKTGSSQTSSATASTPSIIPNAPEPRDSARPPGTSTAEVMDFDDGNIAPLINRTERLVHEDFPNDFGDLFDGDDL